MGILGLGRKNADAGDVKEKEKKQKPVKVTKDKGKKKGAKKGGGLFGKKKQQTLIEMMNLSDSVAAASLDSLSQLASSEKTALRETDEGYLIVAVSNELLLGAGFDPLDKNDEDFGSFATAISQETIRVIALPGDVEQGWFGIIPSEDTLATLDEYDFIEGFEMRWAIVPYDLDDDSTLRILDTSTTIDFLFELEDDMGLQPVLDGDDITFDIAEQEEDDLPPVAVTALPNESSGVVEEPDELDETGYNPENEEFENEFEDDLPPEQETSYEPDYEEEPEWTPPANAYDNHEDELDGFEDEDGVQDDGEDAPFRAETPDVSEDVTEEDAKEAINRIIEHTYSSSELELTIDMAKFDDYFDSVTIAQFDTTRVDDSQLHAVVQGLRQDANAEIERFHQEHIRSLRNQFTTGMRDIHARLLDTVDHTNEDTVYGQRYTMIEGDFKTAMRNIDMTVAGHANALNEQYEANRNTFAEAARREAVAVYDTRYKSEHDREIRRLKGDVEVEIKSTRDSQLGALYGDRRMIARRIYDKALTHLLQSLQDEYRAIADQELAMFDAFRKNMDTYLRKHHADEVLRSKTIAEKMRQSHEADEVRRTYDQLLATKSRQLEEIEERSRESLRQLENDKRDELERVRKDYEDRVKREEDSSIELRRLLKNANDALTLIGDQKDEENRHLIKTYEDRIASQDKELEYAKSSKDKSMKPMMYLFGALAVGLMIIGILFGFMYGVNSVEVAPGTASKNVSYHAPTHDAHVYDLSAYRHTS